MFFLSDREDSDDLYMGANMSENEQITPFTPIISARNFFIIYNTVTAWLQLHHIIAIMSNSVN